MKKNFNVTVFFETYVNIPYVEAKTEEEAIEEARKIMEEEGISDYEIRENMRETKCSAIVQKC